MSKYLDRDGLAHLWERIQELVATCGGGATYNSRKISVTQPLSGDFLYTESNTVTGHSALTIDATSGTSLGSIAIGTSNRVHADAVAVAISGIRSTHGTGKWFSCITGIRYDSSTRGFEIQFRATDTLNIPADDITVSVVEFRRGDSTTNTYCVLEGDCDDGEINV